MTTPISPISLEDRGRDGARLSSPSAGRNRGPIAEALAARLAPSADVLEVASGTGEHAVAAVLRRPDLTWRPSDPDAASRASIDAWASEAPGRIAPALAIDVTAAQWWAGLAPADAVFCANMIHIAPWEAAEGLVAGAAAVLQPDGALLLYGPFHDGEHTAPSNLEFDASLKRRDPRWGVRALDAVDELARSVGLQRAERFEMPANNLLLTYRRGAA